MRSFARGLFACLLILAVSATADAATRRYAVIVANNLSLSKGVEPLQYADDDGARYYELLSNVADSTLLYTVLDEDSQRQYRDAAQAARIPRRDDVLRGLVETFKRARADIDRGDEVVFYFVLVGHGEIGAGGEGYVSLLDAPFTRTDLFREVLAKSPATTNHIIIDACNSYFLVNARGGAHKPDDAPSETVAVGAYLSAEDLAHYPNTGVILSTSSARESHEWSAYGAGIFSHQVRSAMAGAADVNGDGRIEYSELEAFVSAANLKIADPKARIELFARAPAIDNSRPLVDLSEARFSSWLRIPKGPASRFYLEDARGVRYVDANLEGDRAVVIALVASPYYYVRTVDGREEAKVSVAPGRRIDFDPHMMKPAAVASRGAVSEEFREGLFAVPYGQRFYDGFAGRTGEATLRDAAEIWLPGGRGIDAAFISNEIDRLNLRAAGDPGLRRRLAATSSSLVEALAQRRYAEAARLLASAEAGP